jgi:hypothetical protein
MMNKKHTEETKLKISLTKKKQALVTAGAFKKGYTPWNKGKPAPWVSERNKSNNPTKIGEEHHNWQGEFTSYRSMHRWVVRQKGQPTTCEHCGKTNLTGHKIHWANINHKYKREVDDYIRLCVKCHKRFDSKLD